MGFAQQMAERGLSADASTMKLIVDLLSKDKVDPTLLPLLRKPLRSLFESLKHNFLSITKKSEVAAT
jgi:hypothetical protein